MALTPRHASSAATAVSFWLQRWAETLPCGPVPAASLCVALDHQNTRVANSRKFPEKAAKNDWPRHTGTGRKVRMLVSERIGGTVHLLATTTRLHLSSWSKREFHPGEGTLVSQSSNCVHSLTQCVTRTWHTYLPLLGLVLSGEFVCLPLWMPQPPALLATSLSWQPGFGQSTGRGAGHRACYSRPGLS